ncbi:MAG: hypothetical protein HOP28_01115 [Gemmatimonadales bacterium]|nr:hypothetical protein [Gemmatimonadales bacterium]
MLFHPRFRTLVDWAAGRMAEPARRRVSDHLAQCDRCRTRVARIREIRHQAAAAAAVELPPGALEAVLARRAAGNEVLLPSDPGPNLTRSPARVAAGVLLVLGVAGTLFAAVPGLREWLAERFGGKAAPVAAGVTLVDLDRPIAINVIDADSSLHVRFAIVDDSIVVVRAEGGAAEAVFRTSARGVDVRGARRGELIVEAPRFASLTVSINGRPVMVLDRGRIRLPDGDSLLTGSTVYLTPRP